MLKGVIKDVFKSDLSAGLFKFLRNRESNMQICACPLWSQSYRLQLVLTGSYGGLKIVPGSLLSNGSGDIFGCTVL